MMGGWEVWKGVYICLYVYIPYFKDTERYVYVVVFELCMCIFLLFSFFSGAVIARAEELGKEIDEQP